MLGIDLSRLLGRAGPLAFGVIGSPGHESEVDDCGAGSGIFIAPCLGLTAKHVSRSLFDLEPNGDPGFSLDPKLTNHVVNLFQILEPGNQQSEHAFWHVDQDWNFVYSDLCLMKVSADDGAAFRMEKIWPRRCFDLALIPPPAGAVVQALGFPRHNVTRRDSQVLIDTPVVLVEGLVTEVYTPFRERGFLSFPCFRIQTAQRIDHGFSGGPVFLGDRLCGIISSASNFDEGAYAAALWPLLRNKLVIEHIQKGTFAAAGWSQILSRIVVRSDERGEYLDLDSRLP